MAEGQEAVAPQTTGQEQTQSPEVQPQQQQPQETAEEFLARTGFKSLADAEKSYKEAQAKITKVSQEKALLEQALQGQSTQSYQPPPVSRGGQGLDFFDDPEGNVMRLAEQVASRKVNETVQQLEARQAIARVRAENPAKFEKLQPIMAQIYQKKSYLNNLGEEGLRQAMSEAETIRKQELEALRAELLGDESANNNNQQDIRAQARQEVLNEMSRNQQATIPQGGASRPIDDDLQKKRNELIKNSDLDGLLELKGIDSLITS